MKLIPNWWKAWSVWIAATGLALPEVLMQLAPYVGFLDLFPPEWRLGVYMVALVGVLAVRGIPQKNME